MEDPDEWFHLIYEDVEMEVGSWDATTAMVVNSEYFSPWYQALEDIVEAAIPNIEKGVVDSLEVAEIQIEKMTDTIYSAAEYFTYKWIDDSVNAIVEVGLDQVEGPVRDSLGNESDDIDVDQAATDARAEIQSEVMQAVSWFISDAGRTLRPKLGDGYDSVSEKLLATLESIGGKAAGSAPSEHPDTSWGDDVFNSIFNDARAADSANTGTVSPAIPDLPESSRSSSGSDLDEATRGYYNRGNSYSRQGQYQQAIEDYDKAIELDPNVAPAHHNRGISYHALGQNERAIEDYDKVIELDPNDGRAYYNRGNSYSRQGQYQQAIDDYDKVIELDPNDAEPYSDRGSSYHRLGQNERAIEDYDEAIKLDPDNAEAYNKLKMRIV